MLFPQPGSQRCAWGIFMYTDVVLIWWPSFLAGTSSEVGPCKWPESGMKSKNSMHYLCPRAVVNSNKSCWRKGIVSYRNVFLRLNIFCRSKWRKSIQYCQQVLKSSINCTKTAQLLSQFNWDTLGIKSPPKLHPHQKKHVHCSSIPLLHLCFHHRSDTLGPGQCEPFLVRHSIPGMFLTGMMVGLKAA